MDDSVAESQLLFVAHAFSAEAWAREWMHMVVAKKNDKLRL